MTNALRSGLPLGWVCGGSHPENYDMGTSVVVSRKGGVSAYLKSLVDSAGAFGTLMQTFKAEQFRGRQISVTAYLKPEEVSGWAGLWITVESEGEIVAFVNSEDSPISGTSGWTACECTVNLPLDTTRLSFGIILAGNGTVWCDDLKFEQTGAPLSTTQELPGNRVVKAQHPVPQNLTFSESWTDGGPVGWVVKGSHPQNYRVGFDEAASNKDFRAIIIESVAPSLDGFGCLMQDIAPGAFLNSRLHYSAQVSAIEVDWGALFVRVDDTTGNWLAFDNMQNRPIKGSREWTKIDCVVDVPAESANIAFGILLSGSGRLSFGDVKLEQASSDIATTDVQALLSTGPSNLNFEGKQ